jgi:hypothetical protein
MPYSSRVKRLAQSLDLECWKSYSGKSPEFKRAIDARRTKALQTAAKMVIFAPNVTPRQARDTLNYFRKAHPKPTALWRNFDMTDTTTSREPWTPFKMKIFLHIFGSPQYHYLQTLEPLPGGRQNARKQSYSKAVRELIHDGLIENAPTAHEPLRVTDKGTVFADAVLRLPLPVPTKPEWVVPTR